MGNLVGTTDVADGLWHHVAVTYAGDATSGQQEIYVDGVNDTAVRMHNDMPGSTPVFRLRSGSWKTS